MSKFFLFALILLNICYSIPRFSLIEGSSCKLCHVNPNGGSLRNDYGIIIGSDDITYEKSKATKPTTLTTKQQQQQPTARTTNDKQQ